MFYLFFSAGNTVLNKRHLYLIPLAIGIKFYFWWAESKTPDVEWKPEDNISENESNKVLCGLEVLVIIKEKSPKKGFSGKEKKCFTNLFSWDFHLLASFV